MMMFLFGLAFGLAFGFAIIHWWTIRAWMRDTAWPWIKSKLFPASIGGS